jgi:uncharacterized Zn-finger protein
MTTNNGVDLKCPFCKYKWTYGGQKKVQATCPDCMRKFKIAENKTKK